MRIIKPARLAEFWTKHGRARSSLESWYAVARVTAWKNLNDVRKTYRTADEVRVASGKTVVVFNGGGKLFRLVCAIHYNRGKVFVLRFLTHAEYTKDNWKKDL